MKTENLVTIPQFAKLKGVTHQYIYSIINRLPIQLIAGRKFIDQNISIDFKAVTNKSENK